MKAVAGGSGYEFDWGWSGSSFVNDFDVRQQMMISFVISIDQIFKKQMMLHLEKTDIHQFCSIELSVIDLLYQN